MIDVKDAFIIWLVLHALVDVTLLLIGSIAWAISHFGLKLQ